jgi:peroxiredoxin
MSENSAATLRERIEQLTAAMAKQVPPEILATFREELRKLAHSGIERLALKVGARAPDFSLPDAREGTVTLSSLVGRGPTVVTFYRGGWCPYCDLQLRAYQGVLNQIYDLGGELVAISPQTPDYAHADIKSKELRFPVLTDRHNEVARRYGLVFQLSEALRALQTAFGNPIPKFNGDDTWELPMPGTFVVAGDGVVRLAHVDPDWTRRLEPAAMLDALQGAMS